MSKFCQFRIFQPKIFYSQYEQPENCVGHTDETTPCELLCFFYYTAEQQLN